MIKKSVNICATKYPYNPCAIKKKYTDFKNP